MSRLLVAGRQRLEGEVSVQGAKNSALPIIAATLLVPTLVNGGNGGALYMDPPAALFGAGVGTICYILITRRKSPVFLGSSFAFISPLIGACAYGFGGIVINSDGVRRTLEVDGKTYHYFSLEEAGEKLYEELLMKNEELDKTDNSLIFIERDTPLSRTAVEEKLRILREAVTAAKDELESEKVKEAMKKVVPTYHDPDEVNCDADSTDEMKLAGAKI